MELEEKMSRELAQQRAQQAALIKEKLAQRKRERMKKLREQQEIEKAKVNSAIPQRDAHTSSLCLSTCNATLYTLSRHSFYPFTALAIWFSHLVTQLLF